MKTKLGFFSACLGVFLPFFGFDGTVAAETIEIEPAVYLEDFPDELPKDLLNKGQDLEKQRESDNSKAIDVWTSGSEVKEKEVVFFDKAKGFDKITDAEDSENNSENPLAHFAVLEDIKDNEVSQTTSTESFFDERKSFEKLLETDNNIVNDEREGLNTGADQTSAEAAKTPEKLGNHNNGPMLTFNLDGAPILNEKVLNNALFLNILQVIEFLYMSTKRSNEVTLIYPGNFSELTDLHRSFHVDVLRQAGIKVLCEITGTDGGMRSAIVGMIAYRNKGDKLEVFIVMKGSQGESFEFLGGIGGGSWRTNFQAKKVEFSIQDFGISKKYSSNPTSKLTAHSGYFTKINESKQLIEIKLRELFIKENILSFKEISATQRETDSVLDQRTIDAIREKTVEVFIVGHSQGGGLTQLAALCYTCWIGEYLYGPNFDNKNYNTVHAIALSPARAIGDEKTMQMLKDVVGEGNVLGYCSPIDVVPCLPLGHNLSLDPVKAFGQKLLSKLLNGIALFLPDSLRSLAKAVAETESFYETLPVFAYEDPIDLMKQYCELSIKTLETYKEALKNPNKIHRDCIGKSEQEVKQFNKKEMEEVEKQLKLLGKLKNSLKDARTFIAKMQENYFKAHTKNIAKSDFYAIKAIHYLWKLNKICPFSIIIASQHFGAKVYLEWPSKDGNSVFCIEDLFDGKLLNKNLPNALAEGIKYEANKTQVINEN